METFFDTKEVTVIDNGTGYVKVGYAGEDLPWVSSLTFSLWFPVSCLKNEFKSPVAQVTWTKVDVIFHDFSVEQDFGNDALARRDGRDLFYPISRGEIQDYKHMKDIWGRLINTQEKNLSVLISDFPTSKKENKCETAKVMFEQLNVQSLSIMNSAVLSLFSTGWTTGIVIESGEGITYAVPIFEGYALPHAIQQINIAGQDVTQTLLDSLMTQNMEIDASYIDFVREIKEQMCEVAFDYDHALRSWDPLTAEQRSYELPDGKGII